MDSKDFNFIEKAIDYKFKNRDLLQQAFIRRSYSKENGGENNEVLEFIGDKVLDMVVVKWLIGEYSYFNSDTKDFNRHDDYDEFCSKKNEHKLTQYKKYLVCKETLASRIDIMGLADFLIMGKGDEKNNIQEQDSVKEDLFEAILGAVALDSKWDMDVLENTVDIMLDPYSMHYSNIHDYFSEIQEWSDDELDFKYSRSYSGFTCYFNLHYVESLDPYRSRIVSANRQTMISGNGNTKSIARNEACKKAYEFLEERGLLHTIRDEIDNPNINQAINQLEILARRDYFSLPEYIFSNEYDDNGNPVWKCECHIKEAKYYFDATASNKKDSKKQSAFDMLEYVLNEF